VPFWRGQAIAGACVVAAAVLRWSLDPLLAGQLPFVTFFPAVLLASIWGGTWAGVTAVALTLAVAGTSWGGLAAGLRFEVLPAASLIAFIAFGGVVVFLSDLLRATLKDLARSERQAKLLASEMRHRVKNALAMASAVSRQTARTATSVPEYQALLEGRLDALAHAPEYGSERDPPELRVLLAQVLDPFGLHRFERSGPALTFPAQAGGTLALVLHELATNATKHGALSLPTGRISLTWRQDPGKICIDWTERGGPEVAPPVRRGFGSRLLATGFPEDQASVVLEYHPEGVRCRIVLVVTSPIAGTAPELPPSTPVEA
jgi:two-component sensor histidine kinase